MNVFDGLAKSRVKKERPFRSSEDQDQTGTYFALTDALLVQRLCNIRPAHALLNAQPHDLVILRVVFGHSLPVASVREEGEVAQASLHFVSFRHV